MSNKLQSHCKIQHAAFWVMQVLCGSGNMLFLALRSGVCLMILWERRGTSFPVAFSHRRCWAVKRPACCKIKWGVERIGLICKAIGCRESRKIISLRRKTKCLLNHFKQYRTMWCAPWAQNKKRSHGESSWTTKWNLISWSSSQRWVRLLGDLGGWAPPSTINKVSLGHYVAITWTLSDNCTSEEQRSTASPCITKMSLRLFLSVQWWEQPTKKEECMCSCVCTHSVYTIQHHVIYWLFSMK